MALTNGPNLGLLVNGNAGEGHYNELMRQWRGLDALVMPRVDGYLVNTPPGSPADGDLYIIGAAPTGAWAGQGGKVTRWSSVANAWEFYTPANGWRVLVLEEGVEYRRIAGAWTAQIKVGNGAASTSPTNGDEVIVGGLGVGGAINGGSFARFAAQVGTGVYTVATLPAGQNGDMATCSDAMVPFGLPIRANGTDTAFTPHPTVPSGAVLYRTDWQGRQQLYSTARTNHATRSEPTIAQLINKSGTVTDSAAPSPFTGNAVQIPAAVQNDYAYVTGATGIVNPIVSVFVKMADSSAPVLGGSSTQGDFLLVVNSGANSANQNLTVTSIGGSIYRVSGRWIGTTTSAGFGLFRYTTQSGKGFQVVGFQVEADNGSGLPTSYIPTTTAAVTQTDYTLSGSTFTLAVAPLANALVGLANKGGNVFYLNSAWRTHDGEPVQAAI